MKSLVSCLPLFAGLLHLQQAAGTACYNPNGVRITDTAFVPCHDVTGGGASMCCGTNRTETVADICQPNGLCKNTGQNMIWRQGCTDPNWKDPSCLNFCTGGPRGGYFTHNSAVIQCVDKTWCCGSSNTTCCDNKLGRALPATVGDPTPTQSQKQTPSSTTEPTSTASPTSEGGGLSTGAKIGIGVVVAVGVGVLVAADVGGFIFWKKRSSRNGLGQAPINDGHVNYDAVVHEADGYAKYDPIVHEADGQGVVEMQDTSKPIYHEVGQDATDAGSKTKSQPPVELAA